MQEPHQQDEHVIDPDQGTPSGPISDSKSDVDAFLALDVAGRLSMLRDAALSDLRDARSAKETAERAATLAQQRLVRACAIAIDCGVDLETVAQYAGAAKGTIRTWAKALEGQDL